MTKVQIWNFTPYIYKAHCLNVIDGDTIDVEIDLGFETYAKKRLRLKDVDTPERGEDNFAEATQFVKDRVEGRTLWLQIHKSDQIHGAYLCSVIYEEAPENDFGESDYFSLNAELLESGLIKPGTKEFNMHSLLSEKEERERERELEKEEGTIPVTDTQGNILGQEHE